MEQRQAAGTRPNILHVLRTVTSPHGNRIGPKYVNLIDGICSSPEREITLKSLAQGGGPKNPEQYDPSVSNRRSAANSQWASELA